MKKATGLLLLAATLLLSGCESRLFKTIVTYKLDREYTFSVNGRKDLPETVITRAELLDAVSLPQDARVTKVTIENIAAKVSENAESQASFINLEGYYSTPGKSRQLFPQFPIPLGSLVFTRINNTISSEISGLADVLSEVLRNENDTRSVALKLTTFSSSPLILDLKFQLDMTIHYEVCREVPPLFGGAEETCEQ